MRCENPVRKINKTFMTFSKLIGRSKSAGFIEKMQSPGKAWFAE
jgi:hypothetical protein